MVITATVLMTSRLRYKGCRRAHAIPSSPHICNVDTFGRQTFVDNQQGDEDGGEDGSRAGSGEGGRETTPPVSPAALHSSDVDQCRGKNHLFGLGHVAAAAVASDDGLYKSLLSRRSLREEK